eukprot:XP_010663187.1 PREDICTED: CASP-like protein 4A3 isoform X2 [Vitis vinifera]
MESRENYSMKSVSEKSFSDSRSQSLMESPHSPLRSESPFRSDEPEPPECSPVNSPEKHQSNSMVPVEKYSPHSPHRSSLQGLPGQHNPTALPREHAKSPLSSVVTFNRAVRDEMPAVVTKVDPSGGRDGFTGGGGRVEDGGRERRPPGAVTSIVRRSRREDMVKRAELGFRVCEVVFCLISFSVMAADKTQGWSGDSFDRYKEYRYCLSMTVIAFVYSGFQACDLAYHLVTQKHMFSNHSRYHLNFFMDQGSIVPSLVNDRAGNKVHQKNMNHLTVIW